MDSDGDDIPDDWELHGFDADGTVDVDLPALGAHPMRPDVFMEVDVINGLAKTPGAAVFTLFSYAHDADILNEGMELPRGGGRR